MPLYPMNFAYKGFPEGCGRTKTASLTFLARKLADEMSCERVDGRNILRAAKRF